MRNKKIDFNTAMNFVLRHEGGYVNNANDPGGETKYGISKRSYPNLNIKEITQNNAIDIYYRDYWLPSAADKLQGALSLIHFDTAVNMGVGTANKMLAEANNDPNKYLLLRTIRYTSICQKTHKSINFLLGWLIRIKHLAEYI